MPLFGPLGSTNYGRALYGVDLDVDDSAPRRPIMLPIGPVYTPVQPAATVTPPAASSAVPTAATTAAAPLPAVQSLGTFTTRRTELFGPLSAVSI
jgi:hypothetical protein